MNVPHRFTSVGTISACSSGMNCPSSYSSPIFPMVGLGLGLGGSWNPNVHQPQLPRISMSQFRQGGSKVCYVRGPSFSIFLLKLCFYVSPGQPGCIFRKGFFDVKTFGENTTGLILSKLDSRCFSFPKYTCTYTYVTTGTWKTFRAFYG